MKYSISNIAWDTEFDKEMHQYLSKIGYQGIEIAPPHIVGENPYEKIPQAREWKKELTEEYGLQVSSMQSIWFGRKEKLFGSNEERHILFEYTKRAIEFAHAVECGNLVFGSPKNRNLDDTDSYKYAYDFFKELGEYAKNNETILSMEANPIIYNTNFINTTTQAFDFVRQIDSEGFRVNLDLGTMIQNDENIDALSGQEQLIRHVHISEPMLAMVQLGEKQKKVINYLREKRYEGFVSIEMANVKNVEFVKDIASEILDI